MSSFWRGVVPPIIVIFATLSYGAFSVYQVYQAAQSANAKADAEQKRIEQNISDIRNALAGVSGLNAFEIEKGFWFQELDKYGNRTLVHFDLLWAAQRGLTPEQIAELRAHISSSTIMRGTELQEVPTVQLPPVLQFHNEVYGSAVAGTSTIEMQRALSAKVSSGKATSDELLQMSYLAELDGDYAKRDSLNAENCTRFKARCDDGTNATLHGRVVDTTGAPIQNALVGIISRPDVPEVRTDNKGEYAIKTGAKEMEKLRIHAHKRNFSDGYEDMIIMQGVTGNRSYLIDDIRLESPVGIVTIDYVHRSVTGLGNTFNQDTSVTLHTSYSTYEIPAKSLVRADGSLYDGNTVDVYLYEFRKGDPPPNLLALDTFDQVRGYAGDLMKSFGMPYIQFFSEEGEELHILSSKPMVLTYKIPDMDALYSNTDGIYEPLTPADMQFLVQSSQGKQYPIDREFLIDNQLLRFPAFWVFDRKRGVWDNVGLNVLDVSGTIRTIFYTQRAS